MSRGDLTDAEWRIFDPLLPDRGERGPPIQDKRRTVNGILWVLRTGAPWRDIPRRYGNWNSVTKIHLRTNAKGDPLTFDITGGEVHETQGFAALMALHDAPPDKLLGDKGYDSDEIRNDLAKRGIEPVIPPRSNRTTPIKYDREAYKRRNLIERCVNRLKQFRRIATRYEKTARAYLSMLCIAAARLWIKTVNTA